MNPSIVPKMDGKRVGGVSGPAKRAFAKTSTESIVERAVWGVDKMLKRGTMGKTEELGRKICRDEKRNGTVECCGLVVCIAVHGTCNAVLPNQNDAAEKQKKVIATVLSSRFLSFAIPVPCRHPKCVCLDQVPSLFACRPVKI